jgi:hypothetical protein
MEELSVVADVLLTLELTVSSIPPNVPCYLEWRTEHAKGLTPVLKADRTGIINFGKVVTQATLVGTRSSVEALMKVSLFQAKEKGLLTLLSQDKKTDPLLAEGTFNCAEKVKIFVRAPLMHTRETDIKQFLLLDAPKPATPPQQSLSASSASLNRKPVNYQLRVSSDCAVVRCRVGMDYFLVKGTEWVSSNERECYSLGIDFLTPLVRLSGVSRTKKESPQQQQQLANSQSAGSNSQPSPNSGGRPLNRMPWKTESSTSLVSSSSKDNVSASSANTNTVKLRTDPNQNKRELDKLADELMLEEEQFGAKLSPHVNPEKATSGNDATVDLLLPFQDRAANFRPRLQRAMSEQEKEREKEREMEEAQARNEKNAVDKYLECVMQSALKLKEREALQQQQQQQQQQMQQQQQLQQQQRSLGPREGGGVMNLLKGGLGLGKFTANRQQQQQQERDRKAPITTETNPWVCYVIHIIES